MSRPFARFVRGLLLTGWPARIPLLALMVALGPQVAMARPVSSDRQAARALAVAVRDHDPEGLLEAAAAVLEDDDGSRSVRLVAESCASLEQSLHETSRWGDLRRLHSRAAGLFRSVESRSGVRELDRSRTRAKDWRVRALILDAAAFHEKLDLRTCALEALADSHPTVIRRALTYLSRDREEETVRAIVDRYVEVEKAAADRRRSTGRRTRSGRGGATASEWSRAELAFRTALQRLLRVDLPAAVDWKSWVSSRADAGKLFEPPGHQDGPGRTALTLFGQAVTGKNIVFVLDVSGSMRTTDPLPPEEYWKNRSRTVVGDPSKRVPSREEVESRRRITRAKKELARVVRSLPEDVRFNLISYSSDVMPWRKRLEKAGTGAKKAALEYIGGIEAAGITVTDMALEEAFADLDVDTIYLLTDGAPTHVGTRGPGMPPDAADLIEQIHARLEDLNYLRGVRVFCLGFEGAEEDFLRKLSRDHGGEYVRIR